MNLWIYGASQDWERREITRTRTTRYVTLLSVVLALALTAALAACGSDEPSGVTGPDRTASLPTETPVSPTRTPTTTGSGDAPTATAAPRPTATRPPLPTIGPTSAETDRETLVALYNATDGENWNISTNWLSDAPIGEWEGVHTIGGGIDGGRVRLLGLNDNGLSGEIPPELGSLSNVVTLSLNDNELSGEIPAELGSLSNLKYLYLGLNDLSGEIPAELGSLSNLEALYLNDNELSGEIPPELGSLSHLRYLDLSQNDLSGCVPSSLEDQLLAWGYSVLDSLPFC